MTFSALARAGTPRLRVGPGASWATSVVPLNWASSSVITQYKNRVPEILTGQIRRQPLNRYLQIHAAIHHLVSFTSMTHAFFFLFLQYKCNIFHFHEAKDGAANLAGMPLKSRFQRLACSFIGIQANDWRSQRRSHQTFPVCLLNPSGFPHCPY